MSLQAGGAPQTFQRGSHPIDGIFVVPQLLEMAVGGNLSFSDAILSDHWAIWLDLHLPKLCPLHQDSYTKPHTRRLQCKDPRVVTRYNVVLVEILHKQNIPLWLQHLDELLKGPVDVWWCHHQELNAINNAVTEAKKGAENQCHKLICGKAQWCPWVTAAINKILFWKSMLKWELGGKMGILILNTRACKAGLISVPFVGEYAISSLKENISKAYKTFKQLKQDENQQDT